MDIKDKIQEFKKGNFNQFYRNRINSYKNEKDFNYAIRKAYADMMPRTFRKKDKNSSASISREGKTKVLSDLSRKIRDYLDSPQENFDEWHKNVCKTFYKDFYKKALGENMYEEIHFGKAQKIVNMTFKYLYCFDDVNKEIFDSCHMPLDKYTLDWFFEQVCPENRKERIPWSNLDYGSKDCTGSYMWIQEKVREYLKNQTTYPQNPLEAEFYIWADYKN